MANVSKRKTRRRAIMVGLGLDGGSQETHDLMTEKAIKINEKLAGAGKRLEELTREEFCDIAHSVGLRSEKPEPKQPEQKKPESEKPEYERSKYQRCRSNIILTCSSWSCW